MFFCKHCGKELPDESLFCSRCGKNQAEELVTKNEPEEVSVGVFFSLLILFCLPIVGVISSLVVMLTSTRRVLKNFARAALIWGIIATIIGGILTGVAYFLVRRNATSERPHFRVEDPFKEFYEEYYDEFEDIRPFL